MTGEEQDLEARRTAAFCQLLDAWATMDSDTRRKRLGWLVGQLPVVAIGQLERYLEAYNRRTAAPRPTRPAAAVVVGRG
jgi:hypothetical protein